MVRDPRMGKPLSSEGFPDYQGKYREFCIFLSFTYRTCRLHRPEVTGIFHFSAKYGLKITGNFLHVSGNLISLTVILFWTSAIALLLVREFIKAASAGASVDNQAS